MRENLLKGMEIGKLGEEAQMWIELSIFGSPRLVEDLRQLERFQVRKKGLE